LIAFPRTIEIAFAAALVWGFSPAQVTPRQNGPGVSAAQAIRTTSVAVNVYTIVAGRHGNLIPGLSKDDFELTEDGAPQTIAYFSQDASEPLSLGVAVDTSISQERLLSTEQQAAKGFVSSVLQRGDQGFVMSFDVDVKLLRDFTNAPPELAHAIDSAQINETGKSILPDAGTPMGGTHLYDAVYLASNELMKTRVGRKVLVLVTDGEDQGSKVGLQKTIEAAENADVIVYSIVVSDAEFYTLLGASYHGSASVQKLARETGGRTIRVKSLGQIGDAFQQIAGELRAQYRLGYTPLNLRHDGSFRHIQVKVRGHNYAVRARTGYYDRAAEQAATKLDQ
jgi:VWFA-related protein